MDYDCLNITLAGSISFGGKHKIITSTYYQVMVIFEFINIINCQKVGHPRCVCLDQNTKENLRNRKYSVYDKNTS